MLPRSVLVRASALDREYVCDAARILFTSYVPSVKGRATPAVMPEGVRTALGIFRTLPRISKGAARVETSFLRMSDACFG